MRATLPTSSTASTATSARPRPRLHFIHRLGHGIGIQIHEEPYIVRGNQLPLEEGMVFSDEPGIYIVGEIGVRVEDTVICTRTGAERLTRFKRGLSVYPVKG